MLIATTLRRTGQRRHRGEHGQDGRGIRNAAKERPPEREGGSPAQTLCAASLGSAGLPQTSQQRIQTIRSTWPLLVGRGGGTKVTWNPEPSWSLLTIPGVPAGFSLKVPPAEVPMPSSETCGWSLCCWAPTLRRTKDL